MGRRRKQKAPVEVTLDRLEARGVSGLTDDGRRVQVRHGAVGARIEARAGRKGKGQRVGLVQPAPDQVDPACSAFGLCGGCQLQEMPLKRQRAEKADLVGRLVGHPCRGCEGAADAYGYRNKLELSFGARRFLAEATDDRSEIEGSWLGFHPPGWYSRVVDVDGCPLGSAAMNRVIAAVRAQAPAPAWDNATHQGWWRHLVLREGDDGVLVTLVTHGSCPDRAVRRVADAVAALDCVTGVLWRVNDGVAEVATGDLRAVLHGEPTVAITLGRARLELPPDAFFQVNTPGADILVARIGDALRLPGDPDEGPAGGTLLDLYCGVGAIGLALASRFDRVVGIELLESAIETARRNADRLGVDGVWQAGPVEALLPQLDLPRPLRVVVDPPRVGLHPKAAQFLSSLDADVLVYVACNPASLGRDRELLAAGGWALADLWAVDLFPQTRHVEAVGRFLRQSGGQPPEHSE